MRQKILLVLLCCTVFSGCKKDLFTAVKVTYAVKVKAGNTVVIECYNDYYFDNNTLKPITWKSDGTTFYSDHYAYYEQDYYLKVTYVDSTAAVEDNYKVQVFYNDTIPAAKSITSYPVPVVEFSGLVTEL
jgi:hypothetical protein